MQTMNDETKTTWASATETPTFGEIINCQEDNRKL